MGSTSHRAKRMSRSTACANRTKRNMKFPRAARRRTPLPRLAGVDGSAAARRDRYRVPDARRHIRRTRRRLRQERLPVQRFENRPAVQFLQNRPCAEPEPPTSTLRKRTRFCKQSGRIVQSPARRSSATGLRCGRRTAPSGTTAQKEKTTPTLIDNTYYLWTRTRLSNFSKN